MMCLFNLSHKQKLRIFLKCKNLGEGLDHKYTSTYLFASLVTVMLLNTREYSKILWYAPKYS